MAAAPPAAWFARSITTRAALLRLLFFMLLGSVSVVGALSFYQFRSAIQSEIANNLRFGASTVRQRLDTFVLAEVQNLRVWRGFEVMQDMRVGDVDKRLSHLLAELREGQGKAFRTLLCADPSGKIVAASDATLIGSPAPAASRWRALPGLQGDGVELGLDDVHGIPLLRAAIANSFGPGSIGWLYAALDWRAVEAILDDAVEGTPRSLVLVDANGSILRASRTLRERLETGDKTLPWTLPVHGATSTLEDGKPLGYGAVLIGAAASSDAPGGPGLGWRVVMIEPAAVSFEPIWHLLWTVLAVLVLTLVAGFWISSRVANRITHPMLALTDFARRFRRGDPRLPTLEPTRIAEVDELQRAYTEMIGALEHSREQLVRASKLAVVGEMAAIMAHEVRTPIGILRSSAQLLEREATVGEREQELIGFILGETERLNRLVTMLLECARPKPLELRPHDLDAILDSVVGLLSGQGDKAGVSITCDAPDDLIFECDREQMMQVLLNLVLNAVAFAPRGGRVALVARHVGAQLRISVTDDGPGVPLQLRERIFDPFFTRREGGIGLGLTIVQQIVQAHGGEIRVGESAWGGAEFELLFPAPWT